MPDTVPGTLQARGATFVPLFFRDFPWHSERKNARIVNQDMHSAKMLDGRLHQVAGRVEVSDAATESDCLLAAIGNFPGGGIGVAARNISVATWLDALGKVIDDDLGAFTSQEQGDMPSDPPAGAGNDSHFSVESVTHRATPCACQSEAWPISASTSSWPHRPIQCPARTPGQSSQRSRRSGRCFPRAGHWKDGVYPRSRIGPCCSPAASPS